MKNEKWRTKNIGHLFFILHSMREHFEKANADSTWAGGYLSNMDDFGSGAAERPFCFYSDMPRAFFCK